MIQPMNQQNPSAGYQQNGQTGQSESAYQTALRQLSVRKPIHFETIKVDVAQGGSASQVIQMDNLEGFIVQAIHVNIFDQNGLVSDDRYGAFELVISGVSSNIIWQNIPFNLNVFRYLGQNTVWRGFLMGAGTSTRFAVSHDPLVSPLLYDPADPKLVGPYRVEIVLIGIKVPGSAYHAQ